MVCKAGGGASGTEAEIPLPFLQHMEVHYGIDIHLQPMEDPMLEQMDAERRLTPWEAHTGAVSQQWLCGERTLPWSRFSARICDPARDLHWSSLLLKNCSLQKGPTLHQGKGLRSPPPEEEGAVEMTCDEVTMDPIPHLPALMTGRR